MGISSVVGLKKFVAIHKTAPFDEVVQAINITLGLSVTADNSAASYRLQAGRMLLDLRTRVEAECGDWWKWQQGKFTRGRKDIEKLMRLAKAEDPEVEIEKEKAKQKERDDRKSSRSKMERVPLQNGAGKPEDSAQPTLSRIETAMRIVREMTTEERVEFTTQLNKEFFS